MLTEQQDLLSQFQSISNTSIPEQDQIHLLESSNWNLELALLNYFQLYPRQANSNLTQQALNTSIRRSSMSNPAQRLGSSLYDGQPQQQQQQPDFQTRVSTIVNQLFGSTSSDSGNFPMPGAFPLDDQQRRQPSKIHQYFIKFYKYSADAFVFLLVVPLYTIYKILGIVLLIIVGMIVPIVMKIQPLRHKVIKKGNDPTDIARRFIMRFDDYIGNRNKLLNTSDNENDDNGTTKSIGENSISITEENLIQENHLLEIERPDFLECAYSQALYLAKKEARWLLIYIHSDDHQDTNTFINDILINPVFLKFIKDRKLLVWGGDIKDSESFQIANQFKVNKLPFLGLLCLTVNQIPTATGIQESSPVLSLVCKIQGLSTSTTTNINNSESNLNRVISKLSKSHSKFNPTLQNLRTEFERVNGIRTMRRLQDEAFENSLRADRLRRLAKEKEIQEAQEQENLKKIDLQWLKWRKSALSPECNEPGQFARVAIRLPNGQRVQFKFNVNASVEEIYSFVECNYLRKDELNDDDDGNEGIVKPVGYEHRFKFKINSVFPREPLTVDDDLLIGDCSLINPNGNLVVELDSDE